MKKTTIELIEGEIPTEPVDEGKVVESKPAFPIAEGKVKAYQWRPPPPTPSPTPAINPYQGIVARCPHCHAAIQCTHDPNIRVLYRCFNCGMVFAAGGR